LLAVLVDTDVQHNVVLLVHEMASPWRSSQGIRRTRPSSQGDRSLSWHQTTRPGWLNAKHQVAFVRDGINDTIRAANYRETGIA
jgi:hypothetical protein